jgi:NADPH:quinone reductase-like Zn-dependent oxidoreductase
MRTLRFRDYGPAADVLRVEDAEAPRPGPGQIRVAVQACGLNPADWALCGGLYPGDLPRGIGLELSGAVDAIGDDVTGVGLGDLVFGPAPFTGPSAGASDQAVLDRWFTLPSGLDPVDAAALPMAVGAAYPALDALGVGAGDTVLVHGAGTTTGYAAAQIALQRGARVIATMGPTHADALRTAGAEVTSYGDGMAERVTALAGGPVELVLDTAPAHNALPDLVRVVTSPEHVLTFNIAATAREFGVRSVFDAPAMPRHDVLGEFARLAAEGHFSIPVGGRFALEDWRTALELSQSHQAHGKLVLRIG